RPVRPGPPLLAADLPRVPGQQRSGLARLAAVRPSRRGPVPHALRFLAGPVTGPARLGAGWRRPLRAAPCVADPAAVLGGAGTQPRDRLAGDTAAAFRAAHPPVGRGVRAAAPGRHHGAGTERRVLV